MNTITAGEPAHGCVVAGGGAAVRAGVSRQGFNPGFFAARLPGGDALYGREDLFVICWRLPASSLRGCEIMRPIYWNLLNKQADYIGFFDEEEDWIVNSSMNYHFRYKINC